MSFVLDASVTLSWYFNDETTAATEQLLDMVAQKGAVVPQLWRIEVTNGFQSGIRRKRMTVAWRDESLTDLGLMPIEVDHDTDRHIWKTTLWLSDRYALTIYDACYLELAERRNLPLATLDHELRMAGQALGLPLLGK